MIISSEQGRIEISDAVLADLIGRIVRDSVGVAEMAPRNLTENFVDWLGFEGRGRGVTLRQDENGLALRLSVQLWHGISASECVRLLIVSLQQLLEEQLGVRLSEVCVEIAGVLEHSA